MLIRRAYRPLALLTSAALAAAGILAIGTAPAQAVTPIREFSLHQGHIDLFEVTYDQEAKGLKMSVKDDTALYSGSVEYRVPETVTVAVDAEKSKQNIAGAPAAYDFIKQYGDTVYLLPETQNSAIPWPGWSTERFVASLPSGIEVSSALGATPVKLNIDVDGPGYLFTWQTSLSSVINRYISTDDDVADVIPISRNAHVHTNWAFTKPGDYVLTVTPQAETTTGETLTGPSATYHFFVGDISDIEAPTNTVAPNVSGEAKVGSTVTANPGTWSIEPEEFQYQWLIDGTPIQGATGQDYTPVASDQGKALSVQVKAVSSGRKTGVAESTASEVAEGDVTLTLAALSDHYHQDRDIALQVSVDPALQDGDTISWQWKWPNGQWSELPNASGTSHTLKAEQALDGVQVRAILNFANERPSLETEPGTIHIDDHGAAAVQQLSIEATSPVSAGDQVTLASTLPTGVTTVLTQYLWEQKAAGSDQWAQIEDASDSSYAFTATAADNSAQYRVSLVKPNGEVGYGPSEPVTLNVTTPAPVPTRTTLTASAVKQSYGKAAQLKVNVTPQADGTIKAQIGSKTYVAKTKAGVATITIAKTALRPGKYPVALSFDSADSAFANATGTASVIVTKAAASVKVKSAKKVKRGKKIAVTVRVKAAGSAAAGKVRVTLAGKTKALTLKKGKGQVSIKVSKKVKVGKKKIVATYLGNDTVASKTASVKVRIVR